MTTWYLAICQDCTPVLPQPFSDEAGRSAWLVAHRQATGHTVTLARQEDTEITLGPGRLYIQDADGGWQYLGEAGGGSIETGETSITFY